MSASSLNNNFMHRFTCYSIAIVAAATSSDAQSGSPSFTSLGDLPGGRFESIATAISPDGTRVFGQSAGGQGSQRFVWSAETGMVTVDHEGSTDWTSLYAANGMVVGNTDTVEDSQQGVRRITAPTVQFAGTLRQLLTTSPAQFDMTASLSGSTHLARAVSDNGEWILTVAEDATTLTGHLWQTQPLEIVRTVTHFDEFADITNDGSILGARKTSKTSVPVILHATGEEEELSALPSGWSMTAASAISNDSQTIVGQATDSSGAKQAFVWNRETGYRLVASIAPDHSDWQLAQAVDVSSDGSAIAGYGRNPLGQAEAWLVTLPSVTQSPFGQWLTAHALPLTSTSGDSDSDGNSNLIEFIFATDPSKPDSLPTWTADLASAFATSDQMMIPIRPGAMDFVNLTIEASPDLEIWEPVAAQVEPSNAAIRIKFNAPAPGASRFVRLAVRLR